MTAPVSAFVPGGRYEKMSELDVSAGRFDQSIRRPADTIAKMVVCSTRRSGSYLLCRQLINAGIGVPHEYFNRLHYESLCRRWGLPSGIDARYIRELYARRTTPNGVWATKLQWKQYAGKWQVFDRELARDSRFVFLRRDNIIPQAISLHLSFVTRVWGFDGVPTSRPRPDLRLDDLDHVVTCARSIAQENVNWQHFFARHSITPLSLRYEDVAADQPGAVRGVARFLELPEVAYSVPPPEARENRVADEVEAVRRDLAARWAAAYPASGEFVASLKLAPIDA